MTAQATQSIFSEGFTPALTKIVKGVQELYVADSTPWVIGYSGGKDSSAVVQLVWLALSGLEPEQRSKPVHVITTDTLVENPVVAAWVNLSLDRMGASAREAGIPITPHLLSPEIADTFWVNLIGKGYPAPRPRFRWCTERLKIKPSNRFIEQCVNENGEVMLLLGARKSESIARAQAFDNRSELNVSARIARHPDLTNTLVFTPIEDWSNDDVWLFLMRTSNPWGHNNKDLLALYRGASEDNECPVVVDTSTPSCGNSRFGCWTCTLVEQDKSMGAMIQNDQQKEWMRPLLNVRNQLDFRTDEARAREEVNRDFRRMGGFLSFYKSNDGEVRLVRGPYTQKARADWLALLLKAQRQVREHPLSPEYVKTIELIRIEELEEIRRIWVEEKREVEDLLPQIYQDVMGEDYPGAPRSSPVGIGPDVLQALKSICEDSPMLYETTRNLLTAEWQYRSMGSRRGLFKDIEKILDTGAFDDESSALEHVFRRAGRREELELAQAGRAQRVSDSIESPVYDTEVAEEEGEECSSS